MASKPNYTRYYRLIVRTQYLLDSMFHEGVGLNSDQEIAYFGEALKELEPSYNYTLGEIRTALSSVGLIFYRRVFPIFQIRNLQTASKTAGQMNAKARQMLEKIKSKQTSLVVSEHCLPLLLFLRLFRRSHIVYYSELMNVCGLELATYGVRTPKDLYRIFLQHKLFPYMSKDHRFFATETASEKELVRRTLVDAFGDKHALNIRRNILSPPTTATHAFEKLFIPIEKIVEAIGYYSAPFQRHINNAIVPLEAADGLPLYPYLPTPFEEDRFCPLTTSAYVHHRKPQFGVKEPDVCLDLYTRGLLALAKGEKMEPDPRRPWLSDEFFVDEDPSVVPFNEDAEAAKHLRIIIQKLTPSEQIKLTEQYIRETLAEPRPAAPLCVEKIVGDPLASFSAPDKLPDAIIPSGPDPDAPLVDPHFFVPEDGEEPAPKVSYKLIRPKPTAAEATTEATPGPVTPEPAAENAIVAETAAEATPEPVTPEPAAENAIVAETAAEATPEPGTQESVVKSVPATGASTTGTTTEPAAAEPDSEALDAIGKLLDAVAAEQGIIVYYTPLVTRHKELFEKAGITDSLQARSALKALRPQYRYEYQYLTCQLVGEPAADAMELVRRQLRRRWGEKNVQTAAQLAKRVYAPVRTIEDVLDHPQYEEFMPEGKNGFELSRIPEGKEEIFVQEFLHDLIGEIVYFKSISEKLHPIFDGSKLTDPAFLRQMFLKVGGPQMKVYEDYATLHETSASTDELVLAMLLRSIYMWHFDADDEKKARQKAKARAHIARHTPLPETPERQLFKRLFIPDEILLDVLLRQKGYLTCVKGGPESTSRSWALLDKTGNRMTISHLPALVKEYNDPNSNINRIANGLPCTPCPFPDQQAHSEEGAATAAAITPETSVAQDDAKESTAETKTMEETTTKRSNAEESTGSTTCAAPRGDTASGAEASAADVGTTTCAETQTHSAPDPALEEVGTIIDGLFRDGRILLYYTKLLERHDAALKRAGIKDVSGLRAALQQIRPQYRVTEAYIEQTSAPGTVYEHALQEIIARWGKSKITCVAKLTRDLYVPQRVIHQALQADSRFKHCGRDSYAFEDYAQAQKPSQAPAATAAAATAAETATSTAAEEAAPVKASDADGSAPVGDVAAPAAETPSASDGAGGAETAETTESEPANADASEASEASEAQEVSDLSDATAAPKTRPAKPTPEGRIAEIVEALTASGQTIAYYRTILERNKILSKNYKDEESLREAFKAQYPSFGYRDVYFEPRRRTDAEAEEAKIRRALILGWGDVERQKLDRLAKLFMIPASLVERTLKRYPKDFVSEGKGRFRIADAARAEATAILDGESRLHAEFREIMARPHAILHYATYFDQNSDWLVPLGIAEVKTLRRELANESKDAGLGYVFYKEYCEPTGSNDRYQTKLRRLVDVNWGDAPTTTVDALAAVICAPAAEISDVLSASLDFRYCGGDTYQRAGN